MNRASALFSLLLFGCATSPVPVAPRPSVIRAVVPPVAKPALSCQFALRRLSAPGHDGIHPRIVGSSDAFAVLWEETGDHPSLRIATFDDEAQPLGPALEVGDLERPDAAPQLAALPAAGGFVVFWSTGADHERRLVMRRLDPRGWPVTELLPVAAPPASRPMAALALSDELLLAWREVNGGAQEMKVGRLDLLGRALGRPLPVTAAAPPQAELTVALRAAAPLGLLGTEPAIAWEEAVAGLGHVAWARLGHQQLTGRVDLGAGARPTFAREQIVWERPAEHAVYRSPLAEGAPARLTEGQRPAAAAGPDGASVLCLVRGAGDEARDELWCGNLVGANWQSATRVATDSSSIVALEVAAGAPGAAAAWQTQKGDESTVWFATISCPAAAVSARP